MEYHAVNGKMYLLDPKSPISIKDFLSLLGNGSDDAIKKIARELELVTEYISKKELKSNIIEMLQSLKISEPIEIPSKRNIRNRGFVSSNNGFVSVGGEGEGGVSPGPLTVGGEEEEGGISPGPLSVGGEGEGGVSPGPLTVGGEGEGGVSPGPLTVGGGGLKLRPPNPGKIHESSSSSGSSSNNSNWRKNANDTERELSELRHKVNNQSYSPPPSSNNNNNNNNNNNSRYNRVSRIVNDTYGTKLDRLKRAVG